MRKNSFINGSAQRSQPNMIPDIHPTNKKESLPVREWLCMSTITICYGASIRITIKHIALPKGRRNVFYHLLIIFVKAIPRNPTPIPISHPDWGFPNQAPNPPPRNMQPTNTTPPTPHFFRSIIQSHPFDKTYAISKPFLHMIRGTRIGKTCIIRIIKAVDFTSEITLLLTFKLRFKIKFKSTTRMTDVYMDFAKNMGANITHVFDTHLLL